MRLALRQHAGAPGDPGANLAEVESAATRAAGEGASLLVLPELFLSGYDIGPRVVELGMARDDPALARLDEIAARHGLAILAGYPERDGRHLYSAALLVDATGRRLANHRKLQLRGERETRFFAPGRKPTLVELGGMKLGILIGYDVEFPETVRALALAGAQAVLVPAALAAGSPRVLDLLVPARAYENQVFLACCNRCGLEPGPGDPDRSARGLRYLGGSRIVAPDGGLLARAEKGPNLLLADLEWDACAESRAANPFLEALKAGPLMQA